MDDFKSEISKTRWAFRDWTFSQMEISEYERSSKLDMQVSSETNACYSRGHIYLLPAEWPINRYVLAKEEPDLPPGRK